MDLFRHVESIEADALFLQEIRIVVKEQKKNVREENVKESMFVTLRKKD